MKYRDAERLNEILHYMAGAEPFSQIIAELTKAIDQWCPFKHDDGFNIDCYKTYPLATITIDWIEKYLSCCKYLDINKYRLDLMNDILETLRTPEKIGGCEEFKSLIEELKGLVNSVEPDICDKLSHIHCTECMRLDEALVCFQNYCFYSAVIMAISAVEYRIAEMIRRSDGKLHSEYFRDATLGHLIQVFHDDKYKDEKFQRIKGLLPRKPRPLVSLLNEYRVFAAHSTEERITPQTAEAIIHRAFSFLTDKKTCPYSPEEMVCASKVV